nr:centrosomal protein of 112 kDa-like isoform X2 [Gasterosteus aculeatus aculeatus]
MVAYIIKQEMSLSLLRQYLSCQLGYAIFTHYPARYLQDIDRHNFPNRPHVSVSLSFQTISDLEAQLSGLRDELQDAQAQHKRQLAEVALFREEEKRTAFLDKEASLDRLRSDMQRVRADLEESHRQERDAAQEKSNSRLKQIEREYAQKLAKSAQLIAQLQTSVCDSKEEAVGLQQALEKQLKESSLQWEEERRTIIQHADRANKVTAVRQEYEEKIKGLMPVELRQELEDTIASLKAQVNFLQKRASLLQEDLDACRGRR